MSLDSFCTFCPVSFQGGHKGGECRCAEHGALLLGLSWEQQLLISLKLRLEWWGDGESGCLEMLGIKWWGMLIKECGPPCRASHEGHCTGKGTVANVRKIALFWNRRLKEDMKATDVWEKKHFSVLLLFVLIICAWLCLGTRQWFCLAFVLGGLQGPERQDLITQDSLWLKDGFIQAGKTWNISEYLMFCVQLRGVWMAVHTQVSCRCLLWLPSLASLCRWLSTKGWVSQFKAHLCFFSAVTNNDCTNLKANTQWKKLFLGALFQDQR